MISVFQYQTKSKYFNHFYSIYSSESYSIVIFLNYDFGISKLYSSFISSWLISYRSSIISLLTQLFSGYIFIIYLKHRYPSTLFSVSNYYYLNQLKPLPFDAKLLYKSGFKLELFHSRLYIIDTLYQVFSTFLF